MIRLFKEEYIDPSNVYSAFNVFTEVLCAITVTGKFPDGQYRTKVYVVKNDLVDVMKKFLVNKMPPERRSIKVEPYYKKV